MGLTHQISKLLLLVSLVSTPLITAKARKRPTRTGEYPHEFCPNCYNTTYKPLWCDEQANAKPIKQQIPESWGPHGYNYDGIPWYLDDGYSHYNSFW